jgi:uncharacterized protein (TIGR00369 family)
MTEPTQVDLEAVVAMMPFARSAGVVVAAATPGEVMGYLEWAPERCTTAGVLHGGALITLADSVGAVCAVLNLPPGATTSTIESKTNFFRGVRNGRVHATARPLHVGRSVIVVQTDLRDDVGKAVAMTVQTQSVLRPDTPRG